MNTGMQSLGFIQISEPAGISKNIGSLAANNSSSEKSESFESLLTGFLDSKGMDQNKDDKILKEIPEIKKKYPDPKESLVSMNEELFFQAVSVKVDSPYWLQNPEPDSPVTNDAENEIFVTHQTVPQEMPEVIPDKIFSRPLNEKIFEDQIIQNQISTETNSKMFDKKMQSEKNNDLEFYNASDGEKSKAEKTFFFNEFKSEDFRETEDKGKPGQKITNDFIQSKEQSQKEGTSVNTIFDDPKEVSKFKESSSNKTDKVLPPKIENEIISEKGRIIFGESFDSMEPSEKLEPRNLPRFIENQIKNSFKMTDPGTREVTVRINPEHLGKLTLKIISDGNKDMTVRIVAENKNIKEFLDNNLITLRNNLETSGIRASSYNIEIDFERGFSNFNGSNHSNPGHSGERQGRSRYDEKESFEQNIESIFNNSGGLEIFA